MRLSVFAASAAVSLAMAGQASALPVELTLTPSWTTADYDVSSTGPSVGAAGIPEEDDDLVFGVSPSDGSLSFSLTVETSDVVSFTGGAFGTTHDWYGYNTVSLTAPFTFGSASWETSDILTALDGPNGTSAALWTDTDLSVAAPGLVSFRMIGDWEGNSADMFFGSRTLTTISSTFLMWEYYEGEEIRSTTYTTRVSSVPLPAGAVLLATGLAGFGAMRRRKA